MHRVPGLCRRECTDLRACQPISVAGYAYERTRRPREKPKPGQIRESWSRTNRGRFVDRRQTDLSVVIVAFVHRFFVASGKAYLLRRTRVASRKWRERALKVTRFGIETTTVSG